MTQEEVNKAAEVFADKNTDFTNDYCYSVFRANANGFKAGAALLQSEVATLTEKLTAAEAENKSLKLQIGKLELKLDEAYNKGYEQGATYGDIIP